MNHSAEFDIRSKLLVSMGRLRDLYIDDISISEFLILMIAKINCRLV